MCAPIQTAWQAMGFPLIMEWIRLQMVEKVFEYFEQLHWYSHKDWKFQGVSEWSLTSIQRDEDDK